VNRAAAGGGAIKLVDRSIDGCWVEGDPPPAAVVAELAAVEARRVQQAGGP
jgi:hypothetical protein